jgi:hypothetical protein
MSTMGAIARGYLPRPTVPDTPLAGQRPETPIHALGIQGVDRLVHDPAAPDFQSETSIAKNGSFVVVGYNDIRGFGLTPVSVSGYSFSSDDGVTWTDGGQLPGAGSDAVFGDPDVKTWTDPNTSTVYFFYSSIYSTPSGESSLCLHVSTDGGATWSTPREVTTATSATDFSDKELMGVDPETGRIFISWTNFGSSATMRVTYSDDFGVSWNGPAVFATSVGQGSLPRADGNGSNVYVAWRTSSTIQFCRSTDNGLTWTGPVSIVSGLTNPMNPYGSDRIGGFPAMDVDNTNGNVYVTYASRDNPPDFSDVYFTRSTDGGLNFSTPVALNSQPGSDRSQFFNWCSVDQSTGRIDVIWYDQLQGSGTSDITDLFHNKSFDGGLTWGCATPLTDTPFHAEYGNTTSQPNIGDYNMCVSDDGRLYVSFAKTDDPSYLTFAPDTYVDVSAAGPADAPVKYSSATFTDAGCGPGNGAIEPGETIELTVEIEHYDICLNGITGVTGVLTTSTPDVTITNGTSPYPDIPFLGTSSNTGPFEFSVGLGVPCGSKIEFVLDVATGQGDQFVVFDLRVGAGVTTPVLSEGFDGVTAPALPAGWSSVNLVGTVNDWTTSMLFSSSGPNSAFCADIATTSNNRLQSPPIVVPANCDLLDIRFDVTHNIEDDVERKAWDGALLKVEIDDGTVRTVLAGAFAELFEPFYPWQMNRQSSSTQPLQDLSCWSSDVTPNFNNVHIQFPGLAGTTVRFFWEMGTDGAAGTATGMFVDNVTVSSVEFECDCPPTAVDDGAPAAPSFEILAVVPNPFNPETSVRFTLPSRQAVTAEVVSVSGARVRVLSREQVFPAGENSVRWDGRDDSGASVASGVYFVRLRTPLGERVTRAVLMK